MRPTDWEYPCDWYLYECQVCDGKTILDERGGKLSCECESLASEVTVRPLKNAGSAITLADLIGGDMTRKVAA